MTTRGENAPEWPVILMVIAALGVVEIGLSVVRPWLSGDIRHLDEAASIAQGVADGSGVRVMVAGNSLIGEGVVDKNPTSLRDLAAVQAAFNDWQAESSRSLSTISRILAISVG